MSDVPARIDPASLRSAQFQGSFRKYDSKAVDQYLVALADRIEELNRYIDRLETEVATASRVALGDIAEAEPRPEPAPAEVPTLRVMSDDEVAALVGEETGYVLATARKAAEEIRTKAEEAAARLIRESTDEAAAAVDAGKAEAARLREEAETARDTAVAAAEEAAAEILERAEADAERRTTEARAMADEELVRAERIRAETDEEAERVREEAKEEGRAMVAEAKEVRTRILEDLQRRRDAGRAQIERLVVGRDRLLEAYAAVRENVDEMTSELEHVLDDPFEHDPALEEGFVGIVTTAGAEPPVVDGAEPAEAADEPEEAPQEEAPVDEQPEPAESASDDDAGSGSVDDDEADAAASDDTANEPEVEAEVEATDEDRADEPDESDEPVEVAADDPEVSDAEATEASAGTDDVDELFARLRADREASVEQAHAVLARDDDAPVDSDDARVEPDDAPAEPDGGEAEYEGDSVDAAYLASGEWYEHRTEVLAAANKSLPRAVKRLLADEQNEVLDVLRRTESTDITDLLPAPDAHAAGYAAIALDVLDDVARAAGGLIDAEASETVDVSDLADGLASALVDPLRRRIERAAADVDGDHEELDERLRSLYREWKIDHIGRLASDALISAYSAGIVAAAPETARVRWLIDPATGPCPDCQDNALEGAITVGSQFPTGDVRPQAHPGCSCMLGLA